MIFVLLFAIGFICGLRTLTPSAVIAWAAHLGWLHLQGTHLSFMGSTVALTIFTLAALSEYVADQLPSTPARTVPMQLGARIVMGGFCGTALALSAGQSVAMGIVLAMVGAVAGTFSGYHARKALGRALKVPDFVIATLEDLVAIGAAAFVVSHL